MGYATQQDIIDRYGADTLYTVFDRDNDGILDTDAVTRALDDASNEIDAYLVGRYPLPLATVPPVLKLLCADIAVYKGSTGAVQTEEKRQRYEDAVRLLGKIAEGKVSLGLEKPEAGGQGGAWFSSDERRFTRDKLRGL